MQRGMVENANNHEMLNRKNCLNLPTKRSRLNVKIKVMSRFAKASVDRGYLLLSVWQADAVAGTHLGRRLALPHACVDSENYEKKLIILIL